MIQTSSSLNSFQILAKIGDGAFAQVFKVKRKQDNQIYALKKIKITTMKQKDKYNALNQIRLLASQKSDNIIQYKQSFYDQPSKCLCVIMQYASRGDLLKLIQNHIKNRTKIPQKQIWKALVHISKGLKSLHDKKIIHRDLKGANIFITQNGTYKIGDLNISKVIKDDFAKTQTGTPYYACPQIWKDQPYGIKSDIWSLGCVLYEMAAHRPPFTAPDIQTLYKKICSGYFPRIPFQYSNDLWHIICSLLKNNAYDRPNAEDILMNTFVQNNYGIDSQQQSCYFNQNPLLKTIYISNQKDLKQNINNILPKPQYLPEPKYNKAQIQDAIDQKQIHTTIIDSFFKQKNNKQQSSTKLQRQKARSCFEQSDQLKQNKSIIRSRIISTKQSIKQQKMIDQKQIFKNLLQQNIVIKKLLDQKLQNKYNKNLKYNKLPPITTVKKKQNNENIGLSINNRLNNKNVLQTRIVKRQFLL